MSADLIAIGTLVTLGLMWLLVNTKLNRHSPMRTVSFVLMWAFLLAASGAAVRLAWEVLS